VSRRFVFLPPPAARRALAAVLAAAAWVAPGAAAPPRSGIEVLVRGVAHRDDGRPAAGARVEVEGPVPAFTVANAEGRFAVLLRAGTFGERLRSPARFVVEARDGRRRLRFDGRAERLEITISAVAGPDGAPRATARCNVPAVEERLARALEWAAQGPVAVEVALGGAPAPERVARQPAPETSGAPPPPAAPPAASRTPDVAPPAPTAAAARGAPVPPAPPAAPPARDAAAQARPARPRRDSLAAAERLTARVRASARRESLRVARAAEQRARDDARRRDEALRAARRDSARAALRERDRLRQAAHLERQLRDAARRDSLRLARPAPPPLDPRTPVAGRLAGPAGGPHAGPADSCACRIRGTVEVRSDAPLSAPLTVTVAAAGVPGLSAEVRLFMGSPREFVLERVPCGARALEVRVAQGRRWALADSAAARGLDCAAGALRQPRIVLVPR